MCALPEYASKRLAFCCGNAMRLPATMVSVARPAATGTQKLTDVPTPSKYTRKRATKPAAFGVTLSHATNGVDAASYVSGTHMWNGNAAILNAKPANAVRRPSVRNGWIPVEACATVARSVERTAP